MSSVANIFSGNQSIHVRGKFSADSLQLQTIKAPMKWLEVISFILFQVEESKKQSNNQDESFHVGNDAR
jgi:hypothetical protein